MTAPFTTQLRTHGASLLIAGAGEASITVRVELPETWDTIKAVVSPDTTVSELKSRALEMLYPTGVSASAFVMKLRGWDVLDEHATVTRAGAMNGSIFLITHRHRRAVR